MTKQIQTREDFLEVFGSKFNAEDIIRFSLKDFSFEVEPRLIIGKELNGKQIAKLRMNFKCRLNEKGICEVINKDGEKSVIKNNSFSRPIEFLVSIEQFPNERALRDWAEDIIEGFQNTLPQLFVEAAKAHFLTVGNVVSKANDILPDIEKSNDLFYTAEQAARHFEQTEKKICRIEKIRKNAPFENPQEYLMKMNKAAQVLLSQGKPITQQNIVEAMNCNDERTLRQWNEMFDLNWNNWRKKVCENNKAAMF